MHFLFSIVAVASSSSLILDVVIPVVSVVAVLALVVLGGAVYGYIQVFAHLWKLKDPQTGTAKLWNAWNHGKEELCNSRSMEQ